MSKMHRVYGYVTERIIAALEKGTVPWQKGWDPKFGAPRNGYSGHFYRGINILLTSCAGYGSPYWFTRKQINKMGGRIIKGEKSQIITFWTFPEDANGKTFPLFKYYRAWNLEQLKDIEPTEKAIIQGNDVDEMPEIDDFIASCPVCPQIRHGQNRASYTPSLDIINMPDKEAFRSSEAYYGTLFHELVHSTGHSSRLDRDISGEFGSDKYGQEELVAEIGSAMLLASFGLSPDIENSAAYIDGWLTAIQKDDKMIVKASGRAQKAVDMVMGRVFSDDKDKVLS